MKKTTKWALIGCGGIIFAAVGCKMLVCAFQEKPPKRGFPIETLLIDVSVFPEGWAASPEGPQMIRAPAAPLGSDSIPAIESTALLFLRRLPGGSGYASHAVYRLQNRQEAFNEFQIRKKRWFPMGQYDTPWTTPPELAFQNLVANQFYVACSIQGSIPLCQMLAQYEEYLTVFGASMGAYDSNLQLIQVLTYTDFRRVVTAVDQKMGYYLKPH